MPKRPFQEESVEERETKVKLKQVSSQPSMFDNMPKRNTAQEFEQRVSSIQERSSNHKKRAAELAMQFAKMMADKTLPQNKNILINETKRELLLNLVQLSKDINNDPDELEDDGNLILSIILINTCFDQRDRINLLEYSLFEMQNKLNSSALTDFIAKEVSKVLDKQKKDV